MADKNDGGDKTEKPTPKRLKDARKKGDVPKSKDITSTVLMILWIALLGATMFYIVDRLLGLLSDTFTVISFSHNLNYAIQSIGHEAFVVLVKLSAILLLPVVMVGLVVEFLQVGPVMTMEKIKPNMEHLNPAQGIKKMFSLDNLVEVLKSILKTALLFYIGWMIFSYFLPNIVKLPLSITSHIGEVMQQVILMLFIWTVSIFSLIAILDAGYQKYSFTKKLRMSMRDIKQEHKDNEGDPMIKQQRRQAHQEWSQQSAISASSSANVMVVNPTHYAIAIDYDRELTPVPTISAKGEDHMARAMREAAEDAHVPILRNKEIARSLYSDVDEGEHIPKDLFDVIAEVILWAKQVREQINGESIDNNNDQKIDPPGEDLTHYPE
jgi:type III secretion YscU/HrpY family protein